MGRRSIPTRYIKDKKARDATFRKRLIGAKKKAYELSVLCGQDTFLYVRDQITGRVKSFSSTSENFIPDYTKIKFEDRSSSEDMNGSAGKRQLQSVEKVIPENANTQFDVTSEPSLIQRPPPHQDDALYSEILYQSFQFQEGLKKLMFLFSYSSTEGKVSDTAPSCLAKVKQPMLTSSC